ncbi:MAG: sigma 54-interacting transcriptional regulator [Firmicutes bacterium]|nr:sigma 54-interacting transcriptional regulator [Bacillota bacterium]
MTVNAQSIQDVIAGEDPRRPFSDREIAERLSISRSMVTLMRKSAGIADSRARLQAHLVSAIGEVAGNRRLSNRELTLRLRQQGYSVSRSVVKKTAETLGHDQVSHGASVESEMPAAVPNTPTIAHRGTRPAGKVDEDDPFSRLLGSSGSLKPIIQQAKAAVLYPPHGLHTLILGPAGVGKNELAEAMYHFAQDIRGRAIPFVTFNCADYAENPQLLLSQLFGHVKGAYTGAEAGKIGLVEKADGGIVFLDEIHRLPAEGQEILFHLMDRGRFRRLGETETHRHADVMLIAATTEDPQASLLGTFRRRIPMMIEVPALADRPLAERAEMIRRFSREEAVRTGTAVRLMKDAFQAFMLYDCPGNVGQLKSDIQVACARGFLVHVTEATPSVEIDASQLPSHVRRGLLKLPGHRQEIENLASGDLTILPGKGELAPAKDDLYTLPGDIYQYIEQRYEELRRGGFADSEINTLLGAELDVQFRRHLKQVGSRSQQVTREDLVSVVGRDIVGLVETILQRARSRYPQLDQHLFYCLAMHLSAAVERLRQGKPIVNPHLDEVKKEYVAEFSLATEMLEMINRRLGLNFPEDEAGFLAMYLRGSLMKDEGPREGRVGVVVITHGKVASSMVDVAARLLGASHARCVEMSLDEDPEGALARAISAVKDADEGKGVLLLVDMGSLLTFGEIISERTGIRTRTVDRIDTLMVIEAIRRADLPSASLDELAENLVAYRGSLVKGERGLAPTATKTILTLCLTGKGAAVRLQSFLERVLEGQNVEVLPLGAVTQKDVNAEIARLSREHHIAAIVGTVDPGVRGIPFIPVEQVMAIGDPGEVRRALGVSQPSAADFLVDDFLVPQADWSTRQEVLDGLTSLVINAGFVTQAFATDVYRRELSGPTVIEGEVAIPHGDPSSVIRPAIAVASLAAPVDWAGYRVRLVCLLALGTLGKEGFRTIRRLLGPGDHLERLKSARTRSEMRAAIECGLGLQEERADSI